jgi:hypothetical protein
VDERKSSGLVQNVKIIAMKSLYTIAVIGAVMLSSCSVYRQGQTPDDVYYSPAREEQSGGGGTAYAPANSGRNEGKRYYSQDPSYSGYDDYATMNDRWLMMRVRNPYRWSTFDDYNFYSPYNNFYSPFGGFGGWSPYNNLGWGYQPGWSFGLGFGAYNPYGFGYYNHFNNYANWNSYYNPYYPGVVVVNPKTNPAGYTRARSFNMNRYSNSYNSGRGTITPRYNNTNYGTMRYNNSNNSRVGSSERYMNSNNNRQRPSLNAPREDRPVRSYTPSNSPSYNSPRSSGSSGGGGSAPASSGSRPSRR